MSSVRRLFVRDLAAAAVIAASIIAHRTIGPREGPCAQRSLRLRRVAFVVTLLLSSCGGAAPAPSSGPSSPAAVAPTPTQSVVITTSPTSPATTAAPTNAPSPSTAEPTPTSAPTQAPVTDYCTVRDLLTPNREYPDHVRTYLDWTYALPESYIPPDLVNAVSGAAIRPTPFAVEAVGAAEVLARRGDPSYSTLLSDAPGAAIRGLVFADLSSMRAAALDAGERVVILSAYRSYALQQKTFDYWVGVGGYQEALRTSARAGHSEHQLGTVLDFGDGAAAPWEYTDWATTPTGAWLATHAAEYGFVMSYPKGQTSVTCYDYEPWHYRWIGRDLALRLAASATPLRVYHAGLR
jgi:D-alanyl-D-alanine carboxypeptidase